MVRKKKPKTEVQKSKWKIGVCSECKIRDGDSSRKRLYLCPHCKRWFCKKHSEPRLVIFREGIEKIKDRVLRDKVYEEWRKENGHPDWVWSRARLEDLKFEIEEEREKMWQALDKLREMKRIPPPPVSTELPESFKKIFRTQREVSLRNVLIGIGILAIIMGFLFFYYFPETFLGLFGIESGFTTYIERGIKQLLELIGFVNKTAKLEKKVNELDIQLLEKRIFEEINSIRIKYGLPPLKWNDKISAVARKHSKDMAENNFFAHQSSDCSELEDRLDSANIFYTIAGENIMELPMIEYYTTDEYGYILERRFYDFETLVNKAVEGWMNSAGHRENIIMEEFDETGIGIAIQNVPQSKFTETPTIVIIPIETTGKKCPTISKPNKEATLYITQDFISTKCPEGTVLCNGKCWEKCPIGYTFYCTSTGAICQ